MNFGAPHRFVPTERGGPECLCGYTGEKDDVIDHVVQENAI